MGLESPLRARDRPRFEGGKLQALRVLLFT